MSYIKNYPEDVRPLMSLTMSAQTAYAHQKQQQSYRFSGMAMTGPFALPQDAEEVRRMSLIHLCKLARKGGVENNAIQAQIRAAGVTNAAFVADFIESNSEGQPNFVKLLGAHPNEPGLLEMLMLYGSYNYGRGTNPDVALIKKAMERPGLSALTRFRAGLAITAEAKTDDPAWAQLIAAANECVEDKDRDMALMAGYQIIQTLSMGKETIPEIQREVLKKVVLELIAKSEGDDEKFDQLRLTGMGVAGSREQWIDALNVLVKKSRSAPPKAAGAGMLPQIRMRGSFSGYNPWMNGEAAFVLPKIEALSFQSLSSGFLYQIQPKQASQRFGGTVLMDPKDLVKSLDRFESPLLRAWIAMRAGDEEATVKALAATPPKEEAGDFDLLLALQAIGRKNFSEAYTLLEKTRAPRSSDRDFATWLNMALVAVATEMTPEERTKIAEPLRAVLVQCRQAAGVQGAPALAEKATQLGYEDLAKRFQPPTPAMAGGGGGMVLGPAGFGRSSRSSSSSSGSNASVERVMKFSSEKKYEAAAREALLVIRQSKANQWNSGYEMRELMSKLGEDVRKELIKLVEPGDSKSLTKRTEYADICMALGKNEQALATLELLLAERPDDPSLAGKLAFLLPADQRERMRTLMTRAAASDEFVSQAHLRAQELSNKSDNKVTSDFFETVTEWLEKSAPEELEKANLTWVAYHAKNFFENDYTRNLQSLFSEQSKKAEDPAAAERRIAIAKRLALAMLRYPAISEEGFRLFSGSKAWQVRPEELDAKAREALLAAKIDRTSRNSGRSFFTLVLNNGGSSSGGDYDIHSSVRWLTGRLAKAKSPDEILPPAYLAEFREKNPKLSELVSALAGISNIEQLAKLWDSDSLKSGSDPVTLMIRQGVLARAGTVPGASRFFLARVREIEPDKLESIAYQGGQGAEINLLNAALTAGTAGKQEDLDEICAAMSKAVFGEKIDWENQDESQQFYQKISILENLFRQQALDPVSAVKLYRTLFRLGIPVGDDDYSILQPFQKQRYTKPEELESLFESLGWFGDVSSWEPFAAVIVQFQHSSGTMTFSRESKLMNERMNSYMNMSFSRSDLVKRLRERKPATFGTLITAASMASGGERSELAAAAFAAAGPALAKLPAARVESLSLLLPWLPAEASAKLPASFREKAKDSDERKRKDLMKTADDFMANKSQQNSGYSNPFDQIQPTVIALAPLDLEKSVNLFLEAERRYTTSLTRGGRLSSYTSNDLQVTERDESLSDVLNDSDSVMDKDPVLALRFLTAVLKSPEGGRFSLAASDYEGQPLLSALGENLRSGEKTKESPWLRYMKSALAMPAEIRMDAVIAITCYEINEDGAINASALAERRKSGEAERAALQQTYPLREVRDGVMGWQADNAAGRAITSKALVSVLADATISEPSRMQLAFNCLGRVPGILADPAIAASIAPLYERYCEAERSAVNGMSISVIKSLGSAEISAEAKPFAHRISSAFWKNANASKSGGHSTIPPRSATSLFLAAARAGDETMAQKLLTQAKQSILGDLPTITSLITSRQFDFAKTLLPDAGRIYRNSKTSLVYNRTIEESMAAFANAGVDPFQFLRLESQMLGMKLAEGDLAPKEPAKDRSLRLAAAYKKDPPKDRVIQTEILAAISNANQLASLELRSELTAFGRGVNADAAIRDWMEGIGAPTDLNPRYAVGRQECVVLRQAAMADLLAGDTGLLEKMAQSLISSPESSGSSDNENGFEYAVRESQTSLIDTALLWTCMAVSRGEMAGFEKSLKTFEDLTFSADGREEFDSGQVNSSLALCQFLAHWNGQPERFTALCGRMKVRQNLMKGFAELSGLKAFAEGAARHGGWRRDYFAETRKKFLTAAFARPSLATLYPTLGGWTDNLSQSGLTDDLMALSSPLPADFIPVVRAPLMVFRGRQMAKANKPDEAIAAFRAGLQECLPAPEWNLFRAVCKYELANALLNAKQPDEAKAIHASIPQEDVAPWLKDRYQNLGSNLAKPTKP